MEFYSLLIIAFVACCQTISVLPYPVSNHHQEENQGVKDNLEAIVPADQHILTRVFNVSTTGQNSGLCFPPILTDLSESSCRSKIEYDFQVDRLPQIIPQVKCVSSIPYVPYFVRRQRSMVCEEVKYLVPVLYENNKENGISKFTTIFNSVSLACIKSITPSLVEEMSPEIFDLGFD